MPRLPGRPCKVDRQVVISALKRRKREIMLPNNKIISKLNPIWTSIANDLSNKLSARTLYSITCRQEVQRQIFCSTPEVNETVHNESNPDLSANTIEPQSIEFTVWANRIDFEKILEPRIYKRRDITRAKQYKRRCTILKPGVWQEWITDLIWNPQRLKCAFNFHNSKLTQDGSRGKLYGTCKCGGTISCKIDNCIELKDKTRIDCIAKRGQGQCGKRPLRAPMRKIIGKELCTKSATIYRAEKADQMMLPGDSEPPHMYKKSSLINAKHEYIASQYLDRDPVQAILMLKQQSYRNAIHGIGMDPFYVHYWTNHQLNVYRTHAKQEPACIVIDVTGGIIEAIEKCDGSRSKHIFLYHCVIHSQRGQFSVSQMLSEKHTAVAILYWLAEWATQAGVYPKEVVCDSSKALLGAAVKVFTGHTTIEAYADACNNSTLPPCFIRIDVAHFMKMYCNLLKNSPERVKVFYLAVLGQFIQLRDEHSAADMLESILMVARCETDGNLPSGQPTQCENHQLQLKNAIDPRLEIPDDDNDTAPASHFDKDTIFDEERSVNHWSSWAEAIDLKVKNLSNCEEGDHDNAHYLPAFADRLLSDIRWFPLWSSVCRDRFKCGRVPETSASVQSEFNMIKTHLLKNEPNPMKADIFVAKHLGYISSQMKVIDAQILSSAENNVDVLDHLVEPDFPSVDTAVSASPVKQGSIHRIETLDHCEVNISAVSNMSSGPDMSNDAMETGSTEDVLAFFDREDWDHITRSQDVIVPEGDVAIKGASSQFLTINASADPDGSHMLTRTQDACGVLLTSMRPEKEISTKSCTICSTTINDWSSLETGAMQVCFECSGLQSTNEITAFPTNLHETFDCVSSETLSKIPIMKNGSNMQALQLEKKKYSFINTCAFDSLFHAILVAAYDRPAVKKAVHDLKSENPLFHLVADTMSPRLQPRSYELRALMLIDMHLAVISSGDNYKVDCKCNVTHPVCKLFKGTPSYEDISVCTNGCEHNLRPHPTFSITEEELKEPCNFENALNSVHNSLRNTTCQSEGCGARVTKKFTTTGPFAMVELNDVNPLELDQVPKSFCDPLSDEYRFGLIGIIEFKPPAPNVRAIGHYTTIMLRPPGTWVEVDDTKNEPIDLPGSFKTRPHMLIYFKQQK